MNKNPQNPTEQVQADAAQAHQEPVAWASAIMGQAQVFASAWSLVGGRFDDGDALECAERAKEELRSMLNHPQPLTEEQIMELAEPFGAFEYGDAQGHKRQAFVRAIEEAVWKQNS